METLKHYWAIIFVVCILLVTGIFLWVEGYTGILGGDFTGLNESNVFFYLQTGWAEFSSCLVIPLGFLILLLILVIRRIQLPSSNIYGTTCLATMILLLCSLFVLFIYVASNIDDSWQSDQLAHMELDDKTYYVILAHFRALAYRHILIECNQLSLCHVVFQQDWNGSNDDVGNVQLKVNSASQPKSIVLQIGDRVVYSTSP